MSAPRPASFAALVRRRVAGLAFLVVIALLVGLTVALYDKAFTPVALVTLQADRIGNQLSPPADVKLRGLIVGEVRSVASSGRGATIRLALQPDKLPLIPRNVEAQLLPKTLFGEKYVALVLPASPTVARLAAGDTIPQDRSSTAIETEQVLDNLLPLLQTLKPEQVSLTLNALAGALRGRGNRLGDSIVRTGAYLARLDPQLSALQRDNQLLGTVTTNYAAAAPDLLRVLDNLSFSSRTLVDQQHQLDAFLRATTGFAGTARDVVSQNAERLVTLARISLPTLQTLARYAPEFPCLAAGLVAFQPRVEKAFGGAQPGLHITLEVVKDNGPYTDGEQPKYYDDRGPQCYGLPHPVVPLGDINFNDGYKDGAPSTLNTTGAAPDPAGALLRTYLSGPQGQRGVLKAAVAPLLGDDPGQVPDLVTLLFGPLARGTSVSVG